MQRITKEQSLNYRRLDPEKKVLQLTMNNVLVKEWPSMAEAGRYFKTDASNTMKSCKSSVRTCKGYKWVYASL